MKVKGITQRRKGAKERKEKAMFALRVEPCHDACRTEQHWVGAWPFFDRMNRIYRMHGKGYEVFILSLESTGFNERRHRF